MDRKHQLVLGRLRKLENKHSQLAEEVVRLRGKILTIEKIDVGQMGSLINRMATLEAICRLDIQTKGKKTTKEIPATLYDASTYSNSAVPVSAAIQAWAFVPKSAKNVRIVFEVDEEVAEEKF